MKATKAKLGRPRVPKKLAKGSLLSVRLTQDERHKIEAAAERDGVALSEWARQAMLRRANERGS